VSAALAGSNASASFAATASPAPASRLVPVGGDAQTGKVGSQLTSDLIVRASDAVGNPIGGVPVTFVVVSGGGSVSAGSVLSDTLGNARVKWTLGTIAGIQTVVASAGSITPISFTAAATPDAPTQFVVVSGANQTANPGTPLPDSVVVRLVDQYGNGVSGVSVAWSVAAGNGSVSPATGLSNAQGRLATKWTLGNNGGPMSITATAGSVQGKVTGAAFIVFATVGAGGRSTCGIDDGGVLYCWGFNGDGQLGIGAGPSGSGPIYAVPQSVPPVTNQTFATIEGGLFHNCAVTFSHVGYCWGNDNNGQLGVGSPNLRSVETPTEIKLSIPFISISSGRVHSCGITIGGRGYCWGDNERGQLGASIGFDTTSVPGSTLVTFHSTSDPAEIGSPFGSGTYFLGPWDWSAIAAGGVHTCAVRNGGTVYCWGLGREGQLGNGANNVDNYFPQLVAIGSPVDSIKAGYKHSCARTTNGSVLCWGDNTDGQLGNGSNTASNVPVVVANGLTFTTISAGYSHTCGIAAGGAAYCWGLNDHGQLGNGGTTSQNTPVAVSGGLTFASISAGDFHTCGVTTSGVAYCWGDNEYGTVGDGTQASRTVPTKVRFQQ
jgi:hypothetical protein